MSIEQRLYEWLGTDFGGTPAPPMDQTTSTYRVADDLEWVYKVSNDGFELWIGTPSKWYWHTDRAGARRLMWFLFRWWVGEWFGLRRWLWYGLLSRRVARHKRWMRSGDGTVDRP